MGDDEQSQEMVYKVFGMAVGMPPKSGGGLCRALEVHHGRFY